MIPNNKNNYNKTQLLLLCSAMLCGSTVFSLDPTPAKGSMTNIISKDMIINACKSNVTDDSDSPFKGFQGSPSNEEGAFLYASAVELGKSGLNADKNKFIEAVKAIFANKDISDFIGTDSNGFYAAMTADRFDAAGDLNTTTFNEFIKKFIKKNVDKATTKTDTKFLTSLKFKKYKTIDYISKRLANIIDTCPDLDDKDTIKSSIQTALDNLNITPKTKRNAIRNAVITAISTNLDGKTNSVRKINDLFGYNETSTNIRDLKGNDDAKYSIERSYFEGSDQNATLEKEFYLDGSIDLSDGNTLVKLAALNLISSNFFTEDMIKNALTKGVGTGTSLLKDGNIVANVSEFVKKVADALNDADQDIMKNNLNIQFTSDDYKTLVNSALAYNSDDVLPDVDGKSIILPRNEGKFSISVTEFVKALNALYGTVTAGEKDISSKDLVALNASGAVIGNNKDNISKLISDQILNKKIKTVPADDAPNYYVETLLFSALFDLLGAQPNPEYGTLASDSQRDGIYETRDDKGIRKPNNPRKRDAKSDDFVLDSLILNRSLSLFSAGSSGKSILNNISKTNSVGDVARALSAELTKQIDSGTFDFKKILEAIRKASDYLKNGGISTPDSAADVTTETAKQLISEVAKYLRAEDATTLNNLAVTDPKKAHGQAKAINSAFEMLEKAIKDLEGKTEHKALFDDLNKFLHAVNETNKGFDINNPETGALKGADEGFPKLSDLLAKVNIATGAVSKETAKDLILKGLTSKEDKDAAGIILGKTSLDAEAIKTAYDKGFLKGLTGFYVPKDLTTKEAKELSLWEKISLSGLGSYAPWDLSNLINNLYNEISWYQKPVWGFFRGFNLVRRNVSRLASFLKPSVAADYVSITDAKAWKATPDATEATPKDGKTTKKDPAKGGA